MSIGDAISGAGSGFIAGAATGVPHAAGIGAVTGAIGGLFGGGGKKKEKDPAKKARKKTHRYNRKVWKYNWKETKRGYEYAVDGLKSARRMTKSSVNIKSRLMRITMITRWQSVIMSLIKQIELMSVQRQMQLSKFHSTK